MKEWFTVESSPVLKTDNCILVDNYFFINKVVNLSLRLNQLKSLKTKTSIGVWKIKSLKN